MFTTVYVFISVSFSFIVYFLHRFYICVYVWKWARQSLQVSGVNTSVSDQAKHMHQNRIWDSTHDILAARNLPNVLLWLKFLLTEKFSSQLKTEDSTTSILELVKALGKSQYSSFFCSPPDPAIAFTYTVCLTSHFYSVQTSSHDFCDPSHATTSYCRRYVLCFRSSFFFVCPLLTYTYFMFRPWNDSPCILWSSPCWRYGSSWHASPFFWRARYGRSVSYPPRCDGYVSCTHVTYLPLHFVRFSFFAIFLSHIISLSLLYPYLSIDSTSREIISFTIPFVVNFWHCLLPSGYGPTHMPGAMTGPGPAIPHGKALTGPPGANLFIFHIPNQSTYRLSFSLHLIIIWRTCLFPVTTRFLYDLFSQYGHVLSARIMVEPSTGRSRGFGFVSYDNAASAKNAMAQLDGYQIHGKRLKVCYARVWINCFTFCHLLCWFRHTNGFSSFSDVQVSLKKDNNNDNRNHNGQGNNNNQGHENNSNPRAGSTSDGAEDPSGADSSNVNHNVTAGATETSHVSPTEETNATVQAPGQ